MRTKAKRSGVPIPLEFLDLIGKENPVLKIVLNLDVATSVLS